MDRAIETLALLAALITLGACAGSSRHHESADSATQVSVTRIFSDVVRDLQRANVVLPPQFGSVQVSAILLPASARPIIERGRAALPRLMELAKSSDLQERAVAHCCVTIITARNVEMKSLYHYGGGVIDFVQYEIYGLTSER